MMLFTIMAVLNAAYYGVRKYSHVPAPHLDPSRDKMPGGGRDCLFRLPPALLWSISRFGIEEAVRVSCYLAGCVQTVFRRMYFNAWDGASHSDYYSYS